MASAVRTATAHIRKGEWQQAFEVLDRWVRDKPGATSQPDFIMFCRSPEGQALAKWRLAQRLAK